MSIWMMWQFWTAIFAAGTLTFSFGFILAGVMSSAKQADACDSCLAMKKYIGEVD